LPSVEELFKFVVGLYQICNVELFHLEKMAVAINSIIVASVSVVKM
jgi:hypothetical protein